jgi:hypothetical protein
MAHGRVWVGVALVLALAGTAAAQPVYPGAGVGGPGAGFAPVAPPGPPPSGVVPAFLPPGAAVVPPGPSIQTLSALSDEHPAPKELPCALPDLVPAPEHGHGGEHEVPAFMTPFVPTHCGFYANAEYLLMRPRYTDFDYAIRGFGPGLGTVGPVESFGYNVGNGFRAELGYRFDEGKWETVFGYTYLRANGATATVAPAGGVLFPTLTRAGLTDRALAAAASGDLNYQLYDALVARRVLVDEHFAVRALGGLRFADVTQTFDALYDGADARRAAVNTRSRFQGVGPLIGAEAVLVGWKGFHLYSRAYGGLIVGRSTNRLLETNDAGQTVYVNTSYDARKIVPMGNVGVGIGWQYRTIALRAGYEVTQWQGIFERPRFVDDVGQGKIVTRPGNLSLEGLFFQMNLSF